MERFPSTHLTYTKYKLRAYVKEIVTLTINAPYHPCYYIFNFVFYQVIFVSMFFLCSYNPTEDLKIRGEPPLLREYEKIFL